jgi:hypothetical protein
MEKRMNTQHMQQQRAAFLREQAARFKAQGDDEALSYAADLECEADEIVNELNRGPVDGERE